MKTFSLIFFLGMAIGSICQAAADSTGQSDAETNLRKAKYFAVGGVGYAGTMSEGERALRAVLTETDAVARLERLLRDASPAGQLYALLGLRVRDRETYKRLLPGYRKRDDIVETMGGCISSEEPFQAVLKGIDRGDHDSFLARKWPRGRD